MRREAIPVRAVLFDLDDTLFDHRGCARAALESVHGAHDRLARMPFDEIERRHATILEELHHEVMLGRIPLDAARVERFRRLYEAAGVKTDTVGAAEAAALYRERYLETRRAVRGAAVLLDRVKQRAAVGVVSNNILEEQEEKLRFCGLDAFVDVLVVSEEVGTSKPDPRIFRVALDRLRVDASSAVMIGDSWAADVVGARGAGIRAIWFNPYGHDVPEQDTGVLELRALEPPEDAMRVIFDADRN